MRPGSNTTVISFATIIDKTREVADEGTSLHRMLSEVTDKDLLLIDNAASLVVTVKKCRTLASEPRLLNADIDVLRQQLRVSSEPV